MDHKKLDSIVERASALTKRFDAMTTSRIVKRPDAAPEKFFENYKVWEIEAGRAYGMEVNGVMVATQYAKSFEEAWNHYKNSSVRKNHGMRFEGRKDAEPKQLTWPSDAPSKELLRQWDERTITKDKLYRELKKHGHPRSLVANWIDDFEGD